MRIIVDKEFSDRESERMVVTISDEMVLRIGRKYFELAASPDILIPDPETVKVSENQMPFDDPPIVTMAQEVKKFCEGQSNCATCPFRKEVSGRGVWFCKLSNGNKSFNPSDWEV